jgi:hypothetical protein
MTLWQASHEWEFNGRDDSDWYVVAYDEQSDTLRRVQVGSTRYAGCGEHGRRICYRCAGIEEGKPDPETFAKMEACKRRTTIEWLTRLAQNEIDHPREPMGQRIRTTEVVRNRPRANGRATKGAVVVWPVGTTGTVVRVFRNMSQYGTWDYGSTIIVRTDDGREFRCPIRSLRLDHDVDAEQVASLADTYRDPYPMFATAPNTGRVA